MKIVAILEVNDKFMDEENEYSYDEMIDNFVGYYPFPDREKETVVVTKNNFFSTRGLDIFSFKCGHVL